MKYKDTLGTSCAYLLGNENFPDNKEEGDISQVVLSSPFWKCTGVASFSPKQKANTPTQGV